MLRIGGKDTELLGIDRAVEHEASLAAAALGIGPEVVAFVEPEGYLVTRFVEGEVGEVVGRGGGGAPAAAARRPADRGPVRRVPGRRDVRDDGARRGVPLPAGYAAARSDGRPDRGPARHASDAPCHNDLLAANFIRGGDRLWIVDWEYAGMGDPAFDLANFAVSNGLDEDGDARCSTPTARDEPDVHVLMRFMSDFREAMWGVVQQAIAELDFDFAGYAAEHFERLAAAAEPRFCAALRPR